MQEPLAFLQSNCIPQNENHLAGNGRASSPHVVSQVCMRLASLTEDAECGERFHTLICRLEKKCVPFERILPKNPVVNYETVALPLSYIGIRVSKKLIKGAQVARLFRF
jgi:hypothetical protein